jgi:hypothetical protein
MAQLSQQNELLLAANIYGYFYPQLYGATPAHLEPYKPGVAAYSLPAH